MSKILKTSSGSFAVVLQKDLVRSLSWKAGTVVQQTVTKNGILIRRL